MQNNRPAKWRWCQICCQHCRKLWWSSYIETAAEMLPKDGSSKVAWPLRPCNVCLFFTWPRATMKIEGFLMVVCCLKKLSKVRCQQPFVCWHGSVAFPILPIHIANLSRLSKCTLPIISIPNPLKLSNSQISYPIWQMSILMFAWRVSDNQV